MLIAGGISLAVSIVGMAIWSAAARPPDTVGRSQGRLAECPSSPNCVCSQSASPAHQIAALEYDGSATTAMKRLAQVLEQLPRVRIVEQADGYLRAEARSLVFRFVDDIEFLLDAESKRIHVRSASRSGRSDFGVNRRRVERIRKDFQSHD